MSNSHLQPVEIVLQGHETTYNYMGDKLPPDALDVLHGGVLLGVGYERTACLTAYRDRLHVDELEVGYQPQANSEWLQVTPEFIDWNHFADAN